MSPIEPARAAFGDDPGHWPLPRPAGARDSWLYAVAAGGQGRYAAARDALAGLHRQRPARRWISLALSTEASFLRQQGWHRGAAGLDGRALAAAGGDAEACTDALAGLAADALGVGRLAAAATLLEQARAAHQAAGTTPARQTIRLEWVAAELAMAAGAGQAARDHARRAVDLAAAAAPHLHRHQVKSDVVLAAALCCAGDRDAARDVAEAALTATEAAGLIPLRWAVCCLLADLGSRHTAAEVAAMRADSAAFVTRHGGRWSGR